MNLYVQRRIIAAVALLGFVFAVAFPALAVARLAVDPTAYAAICRIDTGSAAGQVRQFDATQRLFLNAVLLGPGLGTTHTVPW